MMPEQGIKRDGEWPFWRNQSDMEVLRRVRIYVDADSCPVIRQIESVARWHNASVTLLCNTDHLLQSDCSEVKVVGKGKDAADYELVRLCDAGDVVVTQDYRLAIMVLSRRAYAIHWDGRQYAIKGTDIMLGDRHMFRWSFQSQEAKKRNDEDNLIFVASLDRLLAEIDEEEEDNAYRLWAESAGNHLPEEDGRE